jgi:autotransporter-associated beta strand protein
MSSITSKNRQNIFAIVRYFHFQKMNVVKHRQKSREQAPGLNGKYDVSNPAFIKVITTILLFLICQTSHAVDWNTVPVIEHSDYQAIKEKSEGSGIWVSDFSGTLPFRLIGVVLNDSIDYLDAAAHYTSTYTPNYMGGQAQIYVQAVNLDGTDYDPDPNTDYSDFGGTACWMGQNYGNLTWIRDPKNNYTNESWYAELDRLQIYYAGSTLPYTLHIGDLVEIRTSVGGMYYNGKMNVNEQHIIDPENDFEIVLLQSNYCDPVMTAAVLTLSDVKNPDDSFVFNPGAPRDSGAEHYQSTMVKLTGVHLTNPLLWGPNMKLTVADDTGRTFNLRLGLNSGFSAYMAPSGSSYNITGIMDQESSNGRDGYYLLTLKAEYYSTISGVAAPVWHGGNANWSTAANWTGPSLASDWELHFDGGANLDSVNDYQNNRSFYGIVFNPDAAAFTLSGNAVKVKRVANFSGETQTVDLSLNTDDENCLFLAESGNILVSKPIVGANGIQKYGSADLTLSALNTYAGTTDVESGTLILAEGGNIDDSGAIHVASGAILQIDGGMHNLAAISGQGKTVLSDSAQVTVDSIVQNTLTIGSGCTLAIAAIPGGPLSGAESLTPAPEPSAALILLSGLAGFAAYGVFRVKKS